jgi:hypothetical protein
MPDSRRLSSALALVSAFGPENIPSKQISSSSGPRGSMVRVPSEVRWITILCLPPNRTDVGTSKSCKLIEPMVIAWLLKGYHLRRTRLKDGRKQGRSFQKGEMCPLGMVARGSTPVIPFEGLASVPTLNYLPITHATAAVLITARARLILARMSAPAALQT